jgi:hypothetical protein
VVLQSMLARPPKVLPASPPSCQPVRQPANKSLHLTTSCASLPAPELLQMFRARGPKEAGTLQERVAAAAAQLADRTLLPGEEADAEKGEGRLGLHLAPSGVRQPAMQP